MIVVEKRYALRDEQWKCLGTLGLPGQSGPVGVTAKDNRLFVETVLYRLRAGISWRDLPPHFGNWHRVACTCVSSAGANKACGSKYLSSWPKSQITSKP
jgi:transposase